MSRKIILAMAFALGVVMWAAHRPQPPVGDDSPPSVSAAAGVESTQPPELRPIPTAQAETGASASPAPVEEGIEQQEAGIRLALQSTNMADRVHALGELLPALVRRDALEAARFADTLDPAIRDEALSRVARAWAARDPEGALSWVSQFPISEQRTRMLNDCFFEIALADPAQAVAAAQRLGLGEDQPAVLANLAQQWAANDLSGSLSWAENQPSGALRDQLLARIAFVQSQSNPADAARLVVEQIPPGPEQVEAAISVVHQWGQADMASARSWVRSFPAGPIQDRAYAELEGIAQGTTQQ
ncbi:MAG TPA: hypothetical protein VG754_03035 [Verrucomicrobiae bacterium]|nr:hypothetical protein [Verrucomicrobiae bacterium]